MADTPEWMTKMDTAADIAAGVATAIEYTLNDLATVFGDSPLMRRMGKWAEQLFLAARCVREASGEITSDFVRDCDQASRNMLNACLAGVAIGKPDMTDAERAALSAMVRPTDQT